MSFKNKVVLVTGASSGIGAATGVLFSKEGAHVVLVGRNEKKIANVAAQCKDPLVLCADLTKDDNVKSIIKKTIEKFGKLDVLINNAGETAVCPINSGEMLKTFDKIVNLNLRAVVHLTSLAAPHLIETKGVIINISSIAGIRNAPLVNHSSYVVAKAGLNSFSRCAASELGEHGVRVNTVSPGPVKSDFLENSGMKVKIENFAQGTSLGRVSEPQEVADLIAFLASDKAVAITGSNFIIDNGALIKKWAV